MKDRSTLRAIAIASVSFWAFAACWPAWAQDDVLKGQMTVREYLAECEKGVEFWCSNQIYSVAIVQDLDHIRKNERATFCLPRRGSGTADERNAKVVAAVKGWFGQHPENAVQNAHADEQILTAIQALWPGPCPG